MVCFLLLTYLNMFASRLIIVILFSTLLFNSGFSIFLETEPVVESTEFFYDDYDDVNDENIYLSSLYLTPNIICNFNHDYCEEPIKMPPIIETPPPEFGLYELKIIREY